MRRCIAPALVRRRLVALPLAGRAPETRIIFDIVDDPAGGIVAVE
jgi:hypothetical protein